MDHVIDVGAIFSDFGNSLTGMQVVGSDTLLKCFAATKFAGWIHTIGFLGNVSESSRAFST